MENHGQSEESLSDMKHQIIEYYKTLHEDYAKLIDKGRAHKAEVNKMLSELISKSAQKMKNSMNESNNK
jgi:hypothetical protein